jgi:hypothetical protein
VVYSRSSSDVSGVGGCKEMALIVLASFTDTMMVSSHAMLSSIVVKRLYRNLWVRDYRPRRTGQERLTSIVSGFFCFC